MVGNIVLPVTNGGLFDFTLCIFSIALGSMASRLVQDIGPDSDSDADDGDYVPAPSPPPKARTGTPDADAEATRKAAEEQEALERKRRAAEAFAAMQAEAEAPSSSKRPLEGALEDIDAVVEVKRARRFAGETI